MFNNPLVAVSGPGAFPCPVERLLRRFDGKLSPDIIASLRGRMMSGEFDTFLCYNSEDKPVVKRIGLKLLQHGILPWFDEWQLRPGLPWTRALENEITKIRSASVFVGTKGIGPWQRFEIEAFLREFVRRECPVIPALLATAPKNKMPKLPLIMGTMMWVDFRKQNPNPFEQLMWALK